MSWSRRKKPDWKWKHEWRIEDVCFDLYLIFTFKQNLRKHAEDGMGDSFRTLIKETKKHLAYVVKEYEKIYGDKPNMRKLREWVEGGGYNPKAQNAPSE